MQLRTLFLLLYTFCHAWTRLVTNYSIFSVLTCIPSLCLLLMQPNTASQFLSLDNPWSPFEFARLSESEFG
jgi:hypothetical protein